MQKCHKCGEITGFTNNEKEILDIISKEKKINITELSKKCGLAYVNVHAHIKNFIRIGLVKVQKQEKVQGKPVVVMLK